MLKNEVSFPVRQGNILSNQRTEKHPSEEWSAKRWYTSIFSAPKDVGYKKINRKSRSSRFRASHTSQSYRTAIALDKKLCHIEEKPRCSQRVREKDLCSQNDWLCCKMQMLFYKGNDIVLFERNPTSSLRAQTKMSVVVDMAEKIGEKQRHTKET